jgi:hypothetical protein
MGIGLLLYPIIVHFVKRLHKLPNYCSYSCFFFIFSDFNEIVRAWLIVGSALAEPNLIQLGPDQELGLSSNLPHRPKRPKRNPHVD